MTRTPLTSAQYQPIITSRCPLHVKFREFAGISICQGTPNFSSGRVDLRPNLRRHFELQAPKTSSRFEGRVGREYTRKPMKATRVLRAPFPYRLGNEARCLTLGSSVHQNEINPCYRRSQLYDPLHILGGK